MALKRDQLFEVFERIGAALQRPATLCLIGSAPAILAGQPERQTTDIDVWRPHSLYDEGDLARACRAADVLFDPKGEIDPDTVYLQIVTPGIVALPPGFEREELGKFGNLTIVMPPPEVIAASKTLRFSDVDLADIVWWFKARALQMKNVEAEVRKLKKPKSELEDAAANLTVVQVLLGKGG